MLSNSVEMGKVVESAVYMHMISFYCQYAISVSYYRGDKQGKKIDIVVEYSNSKIASLMQSVGRALCPR